MLEGPLPVVKPNCKQKKVSVNNKLVITNWLKLLILMSIDF